MKMKMIAAALVLAGAVHAEPVKYADGKIEEVITVRLIPATVEITTAHGKVIVAASRVDTEWFIKRFPESPHAIALQSIADAEAAVKKAKEVNAQAQRDTAERLELLRKTQAARSTKGIPEDVARRIKIAAEKTWPDNYRMQAHHIESETAAWKKLNQ